MKVTINGGSGPQTNNLYEYQTDNREDAGEFELEDLYRELKILRKELKKAAKTAEQDIEVGNVALAEKAAKEGDTETLQSHLRKVGTWALEIARESATKILVSAIQIATGIK